MFSSLFLTKILKISFGGVTYGTPGETLDEAGLDLLVQRIVNLIADYDLDGVDLTLVSLSSVYISDSFFSK